MKKLGILGLVLASGLALAGCEGTPREQAAAQGGLLGAATGAVVGGLATGRAGGALAGAAIGGASGAIIGSASAPPDGAYRERRRCARVGYDYDGNRVCREYYYD
ncbi:MAG: glycine zipper domain-containing protein [Beijerinckiaceae bacterium]